jgi:hypothetical protein
MTYIKLSVILSAALALPGYSMDTAVPRSESPEPQSQTAQRLPGTVIPRPLKWAIDMLLRLPGKVAWQFKSPVDRLPANLRPAGKAFMLTTDETQKLRLIDSLADSTLPSVEDFFVRMLDRERLASVRLELVAYLTRYPRPRLARVFRRLARSDPNPEIAAMALEGLRSVQVAKLREILTRRLTRSRRDSSSWQTFAEEDERWISLVRGSMLPAFLRPPPPLFSAKDQDTIRVVAMGDFGTGTVEQKQVASAMMNHHRRSPFDIGITVGDNFNPIGMESLKDPRWQTWWEDIYGPLKIVFYAVLGNHDWYGFDSPAAQILYSGESPSWRMPAPYYTYTAGPIQFFAVDTLEVSAQQLRWLEEQLQKSQSPWKVVYGHHAIFSDGYHGDNARLIDQLFPVLKNRVDLYLSGHEHDMQHLRPVDGVTFVTSGGGGSDLRPPRPTSRSLFARDAFGFTILEASPTELNVRFVGTDSEVMHQFTLQKAGPTRITRQTDR